MDFCLSRILPRFPILPAGGFGRRTTSGLLVVWRRPSIVVASSNSTRKCEFGGFHAPLEPRTPAGRFLSGVLLDAGENFEAVAWKELERLASERDEAAARLKLSRSSDEVCLHRRIVELKQQECQNSVEEILYTLVLHKFSKISVHLVPQLSRCIYNRRFEIWPSKDWELESIHSSEVLQIVRQHISVALGCREFCNVTETWTTTKLQRLSLCKLYSQSILFGYFLKSVASRHKLEQGLNRNSSITTTTSICSHEMSSMQQCISPCPNIRPVVQRGSLEYYMMGFDREMIRSFAKPKSKEVMNLIQRHCFALFGDEETGLPEMDDVITTSFASLKRFMLEAVAFGSFMWDAENSVNSSVYRLQED